MLGNDILRVDKWPWSNVPDWWNYANRPQIAPESAAALNRIIAATPNSLAGGRGARRRPVGMTLKAAGNQAGGVQVTGTTSDYGRIMVADFQEGRLFTTSEADGGPPGLRPGLRRGPGAVPGRPALNQTVMLCRAGTPSA